MSEKDIQSIPLAKDFPKMHSGLGFWVFFIECPCLGVKYLSAFKNLPASISASVDI